MLNSLVPITLVPYEHSVLLLVGFELPRVIIEPAHRGLDHVVHGLPSNSAAFEPVSAWSGVPTGNLIRAGPAARIG